MNPPTLERLVELGHELRELLDAYRGPEGIQNLVAAIEALDEDTAKTRLFGAIAVLAIQPDFKEGS